LVKRKERWAMLKRKERWSFDQKRRELEKGLISNA
jgi:hypothetical protein